MGEECSVKLLPKFRKQLQKGEECDSYDLCEAVEGHLTPSCQEATVKLCLHTHLTTPPLHRNKFWYSSALQILWDSKL